MISSTIRNIILTSRRLKRLLQDVPRVEVRRTVVYVTVVLVRLIILISTIVGRYIAVHLYHICINVLCIMHMIWSRLQQ